MEGIDPKLLISKSKPSHGFACIPPGVLKEIAAGMKEGAEKYGRFNWREGHPVLASTYYSAAMGHIVSFIDGEDLDPDSPDSKVHHISKAITSLIVLRDAILSGTIVDDRPGMPKQKDKPVEVECAVVQKVPTLDIRRMQVAAGV